MRTINTIGVFGAGTMGTNIAQEFALHGYQVRLYSRTEATLESARSVMESGFSLMIEEGLITEADKTAALQRVQTTTSLEEAAADCDWIMETITENSEAKTALFSQLDAICQPGVLFTSDTSAMDIYQLVPESRLPDTLITHYFAPAHLVPLVELVRGEKTAPDVVDGIRAIYEKMGKIPIVVNRFVPGFIINRIQAAIENEVSWMLEEELITPEDLDLAAKSSLMMRGVVLGVVQKTDFTGLDSSYHIRKSTPYVAPKPKGRMIDTLYKQGRYGVKNGKGFYDYGGRSREEVYAERDRRLIRVWKAAADYIKGPV